MFNIKYILAILLSCFVLCFAFASKSSKTLDALHGSKNPTRKDSVNRDIPKCPPPFQVYSIQSTDTSILILINDVSAVPNELSYELRYKKAKGLSSWKTVYIESGNEYTIRGLHPFEKYVYQIRKICLSADGSSSSDWVIISDSNNRTPSDPQCDELGNTEVHIVTDHTVSFSVPDTYYDTISDQGCRVMFKSSWCNPGGSCYTLYWVYDGSQSFDYADDLYRLYPAADVPHNYLSQMVAFIACPASPSTLPLGEIFDQSSWNALHLTPSCPDTIVYTAPAILNLHCGDSFTIPTPGTDELSSLSVGDTVTMGGYPMAVTSASGSHGTYSGTADILLPWQGQKYNLPFTSIPFDSHRRAKSGSITLQSDPLFDPGDVGSLDIGGQICIPPVPPEYWDTTGNNSVTGLPWDTYGFGPDSTYIKEPPYPGYEDGDPYDEHYDPNGYDANGINAVTGTIYNEHGCTRDSLDAQGQPCDPGGPGPYYWLNENALGPETEEGIALANSLEDTLDNLLVLLLDSMEVKLNDSIDTQRDDCDAIRSDMDDLLEVLNYDRDYIYGPDDEYYVEGMHERFTSRPIPFQVTMDRDPNTIALENKHIALYQCDSKLGVYLNLLELLNDLQETEGLDDLKASLLEKIKRFTADQVTLYQNFNELKYWLKEEILKTLNDNYKETFGAPIGFQDAKVKNGHIPEFEPNWNNNTSDNSSLVSIDPILESNFNFHPGQFSKMDPYSSISQFRNGRLWINGIHRAYYLAEIAKNAAITEALTGSTIMPIRVSTEINGTVYTILIDRITLGTTGADLDAYLIIEDQKSGQKMVFQGLNIGFGPNGTTGSSNLSLASDVSIRLNNAAKLIIHGTQDTYVAWDCNGFAGMGVDASVEFCREFLTPLDTNTLELLPETDTTRVQAHFKVNIPSWGDFVAQISITPFAVTKAEQIRWVVQEAVLDFSDVTTPDITFPESYTSPNLINGQPTGAWKGFYLSQLSATLTGEFANDGNDISIGVENMIIDDRGFSGEVFVQSQLVSLDNGSLGGWPFSIDSLKIVFIANHLMGGAISGYLNVPIFESAQDSDPAIKENDCFHYKAEMHNGGGFCFSVSTASSSLKAPLFNAGEVKIDRNSSINVFANDSSFIAKATLNGSLRIDADITPAFGLDLDSIAFSGFEIANVSPYFSPGIWSMPGKLGINVGGFKASIGGIGLVKVSDMEDDEVALRMQLKLGLADDLDVWADARTRIIGKLTEVDNRQKWVYDRIKIDEVFINADIKGNKVQGGLLFYDEDAVYNNGFRGIVQMNIKALNVNMYAVAQFGKHEDDYKYFFVDALVNLGNGVGPGTFKILGLGGGLYYHMERDTSDFAGIPTEPTDIPELTDLGVGLSNITYLPNDAIGIGLKAIIVFSGPSKKAFNGNASFGIVFNAGGGIHEIGIEGNARFMADLDFSAIPIIAQDSTDAPLDKDDVPMSAYVSIRYDFDNQILDGDLNVFLNTPTFKGIGPHGQMAWAKLYFSPQNWFINIGTPSHPCGIIFDIPGVGQAGLVTAYIDIGNKIEDMPPLPAKVASIAGAFRPSPMRGTGKGFAFGATIRLNSGDLKFLILTASLEAAAGFDVLIQDYGDATCACSGNKPGINGWYASGQVYAYIEGKVGVKVSGRIIPVVELGVAAALQGKMPNPTWMSGAFGVKYKLLGGVIKGNVKFRFKFGQQCELIQPGGDSSILDLKVIQEITPAQAENEIITDQEVVVYFNYDINRQVSDQTDDGNTYNIKVEQVNLSTHGYTLPFTSEIAEDGGTLVCKPSIYFPEHDTVDFSIIVGIYENGELIGTESDTTWFITGDRPATISESNILASYPMKGQYNFYPKEKKDEKGYVILNTGQPYLFVSDDRPVMMLINSSGETKQINYNYDFLGRKIEFNLPSQILESGDLYKLALIKPESNGPNAFQSGGLNLPGLKPGSPQPIYIDEDPTSDLTLSDKNVLVQWVFRVSIYDDFKSKIDYLSNHYSAAAYTNSGLCIITPNVPEVFDANESNINDFESILNFQTDPSSVYWYQNTIYKFMYQFWPSEDGIGSDQVPYLDRADNKLGIPPVEAINIAPNNGCGTSVTEDNFLSGAIATGNMAKITSEFVNQIHKDWNEIKPKVHSWLLEITADNQEPPHGPLGNAIDYLEKNQFPICEESHYPILFEYKLPGTDQITSSFTKTFTASVH